MDDGIWTTLDALGVTVEYVDLPRDRDGEYVHSLGLIRLQRGMATRLHRSVLAHECAHAVFADVPSPSAQVNRKQERRADEWAAQRLIDIREYERAEALHQGNIEALAVELGVTVDLIRAFRSALSRAHTAAVRRTVAQGSYEKVR
ncbi:ImmA/IrrE family metallo-endopeptidase [Microbacterium sp. SORGH_AS_0888]|uniref:ImmA/IrrE family metallo-endopeptidase n=1 Tax=Microbacterium sp. SORGH_AS_0888 TaxID=3041791 RepID=UPI00277E947C|nr:ImmA/IrrE family metallo-endopeptidase [Microbacterium sp. SORGH_AS_0888]MDQ1131175.1 Zn-dependent peptidase ImmA (M78 family) [Microbacterium sp. SORGH_AS_0888]